MNSRFFTVVFIFCISLSVIAKESTQRRVAKGTSALGSLVTGYAGIKNTVISIKELRKANLQTLFILRKDLKATSIHTREMARAFNAGDELIIRYTSNPAVQDELNRVRKARQEMADETKRLNQLESKLKNTKSKDAQYLKMLRTEQSRLKESITMFQRYIKRSEEAAVRLMRSNNAQIKTTRFIVSSQTRTESRLKGFIQKGNSITRVYKIKAPTLAKIAKNSRNGLMLGATAVALGVVATSDIISGKVKSRKDKKLASMLP